MELRILSGLHRGGVLELDADAGQLTLGASPQADVPLADAGIAAIHCRLALRGPHWHLEPAQGRVFDARGQPVQAAVALAPGACLRVADIWIGFYAETDPWPDGTPGVASASTLAAAATDEARGGRYPRVKASVAGGVLAIALLPVAAWFVSSAWGRVGQQLNGKVAAGPVQAAASQAESPAASPAALAEEFVRGLKERELVDRLQLSLQEDRWEIRGSLDAEEQQRFERLLVRFFQNRQPAFPIQVTLLSPAELLPFKVVEAISGKGAGIVTDGGERIFVGDTVQGYRLSSVESGKVVFTGKQRVEVTL